MIGGRVVRWVVLVVLSGCAAQPVRLGPDSDPKVARELLADAARAGPVRLEVNGLPSTADAPTTAAHLGEQAARGIRGLNVHFDPTAAATGSARLVLVFDPPTNLRPRAVCAASAPLLPQESSPPARVQAIFCDGGTFIADSTTTAAGATLADIDRIVWRVAGTLFPDDYPQSYGIRSFFGL